MNKYLEEFSKLNKEQIFQQRKDKFLEIGKQKSFTQFLADETGIVEKYIFFKDKKILAIILLVLLLLGALLLR